MCTSKQYLIRLIGKNGKKMAIRTPPRKKNVDRKHFFQIQHQNERFFSKKAPFLLILCTSKIGGFWGFQGVFGGFSKVLQKSFLPKQGFLPLFEKSPIFLKIPDFQNLSNFGVTKMSLYETIHTKPMAMVLKSAFLEHPLYERYRSIRLCTF